VRNPRNNIWRDADGELSADEDGPSTADIIAAIEAPPVERKSPLSYWIDEPRRQSAGAS
jgi:hypothetical protein